MIGIGRFLGEGVAGQHAAAIVEVWWIVSVTRANMQANQCSGGAGGMRTATFSEGHSRFRANRFASRPARWNGRC